MQFFGIIPARYQSTRLPGKPLALIGGKPMIQRVYEQALKTNVLSCLVVATDDARIFDVVTGFGGRAIMTSANHPSGTDRCFEAAKEIVDGIDNNAVIINIQGDEPFIDPGLIDLLADCFDNTEVEIATLIKEITTADDLFSAKTAKVVVDENRNAVYFSRSPIPYLRNHDKDHWIENHVFYKHIGIYAYRLDVLQKLVGLKQSPLELAESLEQLRWIENGYVINTKLTEHEGFAVDTADDLQKANNMV